MDTPFQILLLRSSKGRSAEKMREHVGRAFVVVVCLVGLLRPEVTRAQREEHCTLAQGFWGDAGAKFKGKTAAVLLNSLITSESPIVVGKVGVRSLSIPHGAAACIVNRLPAGGVPSPLPQTLGDAVLVGLNDCNTSPSPIRLLSNPSNGKHGFRNSLLGETIALAINLRNDSALASMKLSPSVCTQGKLLNGDPDVNDVRTFTIPGAVLNAFTELNLPKSIAGLLELANRALAGQSTSVVDLKDINNAVVAVNSAFSGCRFLVICN